MKLTAIWGCVWIAGVEGVLSRSGGAVGLVRILVVCVGMGHIEIDWYLGLCLVSLQAVWGETGIDWDFCLRWD